MRRTCVELFAGGGGAALGLRAAGLHSLACVEGDAAACATLQANGFPARHAWIGTPPDGADLPAWDAVGDGAVGCWLLWASPPCQPYSRAGKQMGHSDGRDGWPATVEAIRTIRPAWFVIENVVGFPAQEKAAELVAAGLCASARVWDLDAVRYGLPSRRRRLFIIGRRDPGPMPRIPLFTHYAPEDEALIQGADGVREALLAQMQRWVSMGEALPHLASTGHAGSGQAMYYTPEQTLGQAESRPEMLDNPSPCVVCSEEKGTRARRATAWTYNGGPDRAADAAFMATGRRRLEPEEVAVLVGFPTTHRFMGNKGQVYRQIGNAVAPIMAQRIAQAILLCDGINNSEKE